MFKKNIGPGPLIAAAFIGPGTVTICSIAGLEFGFTLLWALVLSIFSTIVLQEMAARLGIVSKKGLSEIIRTEIKEPASKKLIMFLIISAIVVGNAAYEAGNISGGVLGLESIFGEINYAFLGLKINFYSIFMGLIAFGILFSGNYKVLEKSLIFLVMIMSVSFLITAIISGPNLTELLEGVFIPKIPDNSTLIIIGLIGTTVVPYNLFLHTSLSKERWKKNSDLKYAKRDTIVSIVLGGLISMCIVVSSSSLNIEEIN
ncbi:MAG: manganese transporter, partial [Flavobacteriales bacterium]|nr:manganese transporter [Flavobacteriales bacterium]